jgi:hypothetical protein
MVVLAAKSFRCPWSQPQRPKAIENWPSMACCPAEWAERGGSGYYLYSDGQSIPPVLNDRTACPGCELLVITAAVSSGILLNVHCGPSWLKSHFSGSVLTPWPVPPPCMVPATQSRSVQDHVVVYILRQLLSTLIARWLENLYRQSETEIQRGKGAWLDGSAHLPSWRVLRWWGCRVQARFVDKETNMIFSCYGALFSSI